MKQLIQYLKKFYAEEFDLKYTLVILAFLSLLLYLNFGDTYIHTQKRFWRWQEETAWWYYFSLYGICFLLPLGLYKLFPKIKTDFLKQSRFWIIALFAIALFACRSSFYYYFSQHWTTGWEKSTVQDAATFRIIFILLKSTIILIPLLIYWCLVDKRNQPFYGMKRNTLNLKPYLILLLILIPFVALASQDASFLRKYPRAQAIGGIDLFNPEHGGLIAIYETLYIADFYIIELFFRGFMILAFVKVGGPKIILPVAVFYCSIHFTKPFPEALSSFFGGAILGIITYYSRSIWGGIIIHMGIAGVMELGAYIGHSLNR